MEEDGKNAFSRGANKNSMVRKILFCLLTLCLLVNNHARAQESNLEFKHLTISEGLSHSSVECILQDRSGFLWFGTENGLTRYDGYHCKVFLPQPRQGDGLSGRSSHNRLLFEDSKGLIWASFANGGLARYDPAKEIFDNFAHNPDSAGSLSNDLVTCMFEDRTHTFWVGTANGLNRYDRASGRFQPYYFSDEGQTMSNYVTTMYQDRQGRFWVGTRHGLFLFHPTTGQFRAFYPDGQEPKQQKAPLRRNWITAIHQDRQGNFWVGTDWFGLFKFNSSVLNAPSSTPVFSGVFPLPWAETKVHFIHESKRGDLWVGTQRGVARFFSDTLRRPAVSFYLSEPSYLGKSGEYATIRICEDLRGQMWVASTNGLYHFDESRNVFQVYRHNPTDPQSLSVNNVTALYQDRNGVLWVGSIKGGMNFVALHQKPFVHYRHIPQQPQSLDHPDVYSITEDAQGDLWVGTLTGLNRIQSGTGQYQVFRSAPLHNKGPQMIGVILPDPKGYFWIGFYDGQLGRFYPQTGRFELFSYHPQVANSIVSWSIRALHQDRHQQLWIGACTAGLGRMDPERQTFSYYMPDSANFSNPVSRNPNFTTNDIEIRAIYEDPQGMIWIGTVSGGLNRFDRRTGTFRHFTQDPNNPRSIGSNTVQVIHRDRSGHMWIGTAGGGLNRFDPQTATFHRYSIRDGLPSNTVYGILEDDRGHLWLSTNNGLSRFDPQKETFRNYYESDGLQSNEFNPGAYFKSKSGWMYFGGGNGVTAFHPEHITDDSQPPRVQLTDFKIFNESVPIGKAVMGAVILPKAIGQTQEIVLSYRAHTFSFDFVGLHFASPERTRYAYQMTGFDTQWTYTDASHRTATYTNLDAGEYTFRVRAANGDGHWSKEEAQVRLIITPPFWKTTWFKGLVVLMMVLGVIAAVRIRTHRLGKQKQQLEREVAARTQEVLNQKEEIEVQRDNLESQYRNIRVLSEMGQVITASLRLEEIFQILYRQVNELMDAPSFGIGLIDEDHKTLEYLSRENPHDPVTTRSRTRLDEQNLSTWCYVHQKMVLLNDVEKEIAAYDSWSKTEYTEAGQPQSRIYLPLLGNGKRVIGIMVVKSYRKHAFSDVHVSILITLATYVAIALDNATAYDAIIRQKDQIEEMSDKVREANESKLRFFSNISHEFRTPLTLILGPLEQMMTHDSTEDAHAMASYRLMYRNAERLLRLINQLTDLQKLDSNQEQLTLQKGNVGAFVTGITRLFQDLAVRNQVTLDCHIQPVWGTFDGDKLEKILYNLLSNAFKHTLPGGKVTVCVRALSSANPPQVEISVSDTGSGISPAHLPLIFERFYKVDKHPGAYHKGVGIGLSLTKELVELLGGTIQVQSEVGEQTAFQVCLPIEYASIHPEITTLDAAQNAFVFTQKGLSADDHFPTSLSLPLPEPTAANGPLVLIVDDQPDIRQYLKTHFAPNYRLLEASQGEEAWAMALEKLPDLVISDVMMPELDGFGLCERLKTDERTSHIPVLLLTARSGDESHLHGLETGADDYVCKPFSIHLLQARARNLIQIRSKLRDRFQKTEARDVAQLGVNSTEQRFLEKLLLIIEKHLDNPELDAQMLVREMGMSRTNLYGKLKAVSGLSINLFIRSIRLKKAAELLRQGNLSVAEIAFSVGFNDPAYFSRCFSETHLQSPTQYAAANRNLVH